MDTTQDSLGLSLLLCKMTFGPLTVVCVSPLKWFCVRKNLATGMLLRVCVCVGGGSPIPGVLAITLSALSLKEDPWEFCSRKVRGW